MDKDKIINKIRNLLELSSNNPSGEEAKAAFLKAQELMYKYHIENPETIEEEEVYRAEYNLGILKKTKFVLMLSVLCADNFRSKTYSRFNNVYFLGFEEDVKAAMAVYTYILKHSLITRSMYFARNINNPQTKKEWEYGYVYGLHQAMNSRQGYELMRSVPRKVTEAYERLPVKKILDSENDKGLGLTSLDGAFADGFKRGKESLNAREIEKK